MSARNWCFTLNNYTEEDFNLLKNSSKCKWTYAVIGCEIGEQGTPHLQGYFEFSGCKRLTTLKKLNDKIHWEKRLGSAKQASDYCKKEGKYFEEGEMKKQGERTDLTLIKNQILEGKKVDEIALEDPNTYHNYGRTLTKIEDIALRKKYRTWMTTCEWLYGKTGVGKSHRAFENFNPDTHYLWKLNDKGWQDGYSGQSIIIINDFRGEIPYNELLNLIDKWPYTLPRRGREPVPLLAKHIIITSSLCPAEVYKRRNEEDSLNQLLRRISVSEVVRG